MIRGFAGKLEEAILDVVVKILQLSRDVQKVRVVELVELLGNESGQLLFFSPESTEVNQRDELDFRHVSFFLFLDLIFAQGNHAVLRLSVEIVEVFRVLVKELMDRLEVAVGMLSTLRLVVVAL